MSVAQTKAARRKFKNDPRFKAARARALARTGKWKGDRSATKKRPA